MGDIPDQIFLDELTFNLNSLLASTIIKTQK